LRQYFITLQVIPLYLKQDQPTGDEITGSSRKQNDDVPAPPAVMAYPPLAYFLNSILSGLNFLRECPMLSAKDALLAGLIAVLLDSCSFFVGLSSDIGARGMKYLPHGGQARGSSGNEKSANLSMDKQYASMLAQELLPHVLVCFEHIFVCQAPSPALSAEKGSKGRGKAVALRVESLANARACMGPVPYAALVTCWGMFRKSDLLPPEHVPTPVPTPAPTPVKEPVVVVIPPVTPEVLSESVPDVPVVTSDTSAEQIVSSEEPPTPAYEGPADPSAAIEAVVDASLTSINRVDHSDDHRSHKD
jgi:hypothetical protein